MNLTLEEFKQAAGWAYLDFHLGRLSRVGYINRMRSLVDAYRN